MRGVHSDAMLANSLTKKGERWHIENYYRGQCSWRLIHDPRFMSAKNCRRVGLDTFETAAWHDEEDTTDGSSMDRL